MNPLETAEDGEVSQQLVANPSQPHPHISYYYTQTHSLQGYTFTCSYVVIQLLNT